MDKRYIACVCCILAAVTALSAEVTRLPFFAPTPAFADAPQALPSALCWMLFNHVLNQDGCPDSGQAFDTGVLFTFYADERLAVTGLAREIFQFRSSPDGAFDFWARALVTDLRLGLDWGLSPFVLGGGYRHDCKHDMGDIERTAIHDALFLRAALPPIRLDETAMRAGVALEAEVNIDPIFQDAEEEPDRGRLSAECTFIPYRSRGLYPEVSIDGRLSLINGETGGRVSLDDEWKMDWLVRCGISQRLGAGEVRLFYSLERTGDTWAELDPGPETASSLNLAVSCGI